MDGLCNNKHPVLAVVGPTASGKTALGVALAEQFGGEIISADSMQIYKGLDVGTAKVTPEETCGIPHHGVDILQPDEPFSVYKYCEEAKKAIDDIVLTDIEDVSLEKKNGDTVALPYGMYITVNGFDGYVFITDDCKVDKYGLHHSDIPNGEYTMKFIDRAKITALFEANP